MVGGIKGVGTLERRSVNRQRIHRARAMQVFRIRNRRLQVRIVLIIMILAVLVLDLASLLVVAHGGLGPWHVSKGDQADAPKQLLILGPLAVAQLILLILVVAGPEMLSGKAPKGLEAFEEEIMA